MQHGVVQLDMVNVNKSFDGTSIRWTSIAAIGKVFLQIFQLVVLARLLEPKDYGLMAIITIILAICTLITEVGYGSVYIQKQNLSGVERDTLYWFTISSSIAIGLMLFLSADSISIIFNKPEIKLPIELIVLTIPINGIGSQLRRHAEKTLNFKPLILIELSANIVSVLAASIFANAGYGVYSLVFAALINSIILNILSWRFLSNGWRPGVKILWSYIYLCSRHASAVIANGIINEINRNSDIFVSGQSLTSREVGIYSIPRQLIFQIQGVVNPIFNRVNFPIFSNINSEEEIGKIYLKTLSLNLFIASPIYLFLAMHSDIIVNILLGNKWDESKNLISILACWGLLRSIGNPVGGLLQAVDKPQLELKWNLIQLIVVPLVIIYSAQWGLLGITYGMLVISAVAVFPMWFFLIKPFTHCKFNFYLKCIIQPIFISILSVLPMFILKELISYNYWFFVLDIIVTIGLYLLISKKLNKKNIEEIKLTLGLVK